MTMTDADHHLRAILTDLLGLESGQAEGFTAETKLFGHLPELDSMAVAVLLTEMEDRLGMIIEPEEVDAELFETFGSLLAFAQSRQGPA